MEGGSAAFEINYPFVYPSMKADKPDLFKNFKWTTYPTVTPGSTAPVWSVTVPVMVAVISCAPPAAATSRMQPTIHAALARSRITQPPWRALHARGHTRMMPTAVPTSSRGNRTDAITGAGGGQRLGTRVASGRC